MDQKPGVFGSYRELGRWLLFIGAPIVALLVALVLLAGCVDTEDKVPAASFCPVWGIASDGHIVADFYARELDGEKVRQFGVELRVVGLEFAHIWSPPGSPLHRWAAFGGQQHPTDDLIRIGGFDPHPENILTVSGAEPMFSVHFTETGAGPFWTIEVVNTFDSDAIEGLAGCALKGPE